VNCLLILIELMLSGWILIKGAANPASRYAVFLSGFWRQDYKEAIATITQPTLVVVGHTSVLVGRLRKHGAKIG